MKFYFRLMLIVLLTLIYKAVTYPIVKFFVIRGMLPDSFVFGIIYLLVLGAIYWFIVYKIWKMKK